MLIDNLAQYLINQGLATAEGTDLFLAEFPDSDSTTFNNVILLRDTGGVEPNRYLPIKQPTIQVTVRNTDYNTGYQKINNIKEALHKKLDDTTLETAGVDTMTIFSMQEPTYIGQDENQRYLFVCNFIFKIRG